ncbi:MAG: hypothetical protein JNL82_37505 [Myxococcales bacterium]|nr:hypothetical protein [Myxococcales bacterium]
MNDLFHILRAMLRDELRALRTGDTAVVTANAPHAEGDGHNHECDVSLRHGGLALKNVPIATPHVGLVSPPRVGDVVLVTYVDGDPNRPIVTGRLYSDEAPPPVHADGELVLSTPPDHTTRVALQPDGAVQIAAGKTRITVARDGAVTLTGEQDLVVTVKGDARLRADGNVELTCADAKIHASGSIDLGDGGDGVITTGSHKCYITGKPLVGSASVKAKG